MAGSQPKLPFFCIDVSYWTIIVWRLLNPVPALVIPKVSEDEFADPKFFDHCEGTRSIGARLGGYHFLRPGDIGDQAETFIAGVRQARFTAREILVCDFEDRRNTLRQMKQWLDHVERAMGIRPLIYCRAEMINEKIHEEYDDQPPSWFNEYFWWPAGYPLPNADRFSSILAGYIPRGVRRDRVAMWQYEEKGILTGSMGNQNDYNWVNPDWAALIGLTEATGGTMPENYTYSFTPTNSIGSKVRMDHNTSALQVGSLGFGKYAFGFDKWIAPADVVGVCKRGDTWLLILEADGTPLRGWVAEIHLGIRYGTITPLGTPNPNPDPTEDRPKKVTVEMESGKVFVANQFIQLP